eukprot:jgi/Hompol1/5928/HPOL_000993-RA
MVQQSKNKKKKVNASLARGFATTSIPKKAAAVQVDPEEEQAQDQQADIDRAREKEQQQQQQKEQQEQQERERRDQTLKELQRTETLVDVALAKANDARSALQSNRSVPSIAVSVAAEHALFTFLDSLDSSHSPESLNPPITGSSASKASPLQVYRQLQRMGFADDDIELGLRESTSLGDASINAVLQWLCLHTPLERLPQEMSDKLAHHFASDTIEARSDEMDSYSDLNEARAWILQQSFTDDEIVESDDSFNATLDRPASRDRKMPDKQNSRNILRVDDIDDAALDAAAISEKDQTDQDLVECWENVSANDFELLSVNDQSNGSESGEQKVPAPASEKRVTGNGDGDDDDDDDGFGLQGMESLFDNDNPTESTVGGTSNSTTALPIRDMSQPGWTGPTPTDLLQQWISKNCKGANMIFSPLVSHRGFRSQLRFSEGKGRVKLAGYQFEMAVDQAVTTKMDSRQFVATIALYELLHEKQPSLVTSLPPKYADLWREWSLSKTAAEEDAMLASSIRRIDFVKSLSDIREKITAMDLNHIDGTAVVLFCGRTIEAKRLFDDMLVTAASSSSSSSSSPATSQYVLEDPTKECLAKLLS